MKKRNSIKSHLGRYVNSQNASFYDDYQVVGQNSSRDGQFAKLVIYLKHKNFVRPSGALSFEPCFLPQVIAFLKKEAKYGI